MKLDKGDFIGRDALLAAKGKPPARRLLSFVATSPDTPIAHGGELILRDGAPAGEVTSAAYGHTVGGIVALGYVATGGARVDDAWLVGALRDRHRGRARAGAREPEGAVRSRVCGAKDEEGA